MKIKFEGLWMNRDFLKFWAGETISLLGSQITALALPLAAAVSFQATPVQMGLLNVSQFAPDLLFTLIAGLWIDITKRRPIMIIANIGRALLLGFVPAGFLAGFLKLEHLYLITFLSGTLAVLFELAYQAYLPLLVKNHELIDGNSKLQISASVAEVSGPGIAGVLINLIGAPVAILIDAISFIASAFSLTIIRKPELSSERQMERKPSLRDIAHGMNTIFRNPYLRAMACEAATYNFFNQIIWSVLMLYMTRELKIGPSLIGFILAAGSIGSLLGSFCANFFGKNIGIGKTIAGSMALACSAPLLIPLTTIFPYGALPILILSFFLSGFGVVISNVHIRSLRQMIVPQNLLGRTISSYRFTAIAVAPVGALLGGFLGSNIGLSSTLFIGAIGIVSALCWIIFSPLPRLSNLTTPQF